MSGIPADLVPAVGFVFQVVWPPSDQPGPGGADPSDWDDVPEVLAPTAFQEWPPIRVLCPFVVAVCRRALSFPVPVVAVVACGAVPKRSAENEGQLCALTLIRFCCELMCAQAPWTVSDVDGRLNGCMEQQSPGKCSFPLARGGRLSGCERESWIDWRGTRFDGHPASPCRPPHLCYPRTS